MAWEVVHEVSCLTAALLAGAAAAAFAWAAMAFLAALRRKRLARIGAGAPPVELPGSDGPLQILLAWLTVRICIDTRETALWSSGIPAESRQRAALGSGWVTLSRKAIPKARLRPMTRQRS